MKKTNLSKSLIVLVSLALAVFMASCSGIPSRPDDLGLEPVEFKLTKPERWELANGLVILYQQDDEVPLVGGTLYVPNGSIYSSKEDLGVASACGSQLREGGVKGLSPEALDEKLDSLGASVESGMSDEYATAGFSSLTEDFEEVFDIFAKMIKQPSFNQKRYQLWKQLSRNGIARRKDSPDTMGSMSFAKVVFGWDGPYSRTLNLESLEKVSLQKVRKFHAENYGPVGSILTISGSVSKKRLKAALEKHFASWPAQKIIHSGPPQVTEEFKPGIYILEKDLDQASIRIGHRGPKRHGDDWFAMKIFNRIFGHGSFESTLFNRIRTELGLAYSVWGGINPGAEVGTVELYAGTRSEKAKEAILESIKVVKQVQAEAPEEERLKAAIESSQKSFVFSFASSGSIVSRQSILELLGYPEDYNETYVENLAAVTTDEVLEVAKRHMDTKDLAIVVVGRVKAEDFTGEFQQQLKEITGVELPVISLGFTHEPEILSGN